MELVTPRTTMVKYNESDFESFCEVVCNDEVMLNISGKGHSKKEAKKKFVALLITNQESVYYGVYKVCFLNIQSINKFIAYINIYFKVLKYSRIFRASSSVKFWFAIGEPL